MYKYNYLLSEKLLFTDIILREKLCRNLVLLFIKNIIIKPTKIVNTCNTTFIIFFLSSSS